MYAGVEDLKCTVNEGLLSEIEEVYCTVPDIVEPEFRAIAERIMQNYSLGQPNNFEEALQLYHILVCVLDETLNYN